MRVTIVVFPGSNCDRDIFEAIKSISKKMPTLTWHKETNIENSDLIVIPGGFTFGDYLRCGALASNSPVIKSIRDHASRGGAILGICNGFQILIESGLLKGALMRNSSLNFICRDVIIKTANTKTIFTNKTEISKMPIAHNEGNYFATSDQIKKIEDNDQIAFQYCDATGNINDQSNPNGSIKNIAGVFNEKKNVLGMMPHPERAAEYMHGCDDGKRIFESLIN